MGLRLPHPALKDQSLRSLSGPGSAPQEETKPLAGSVITTVLGLVPIRMSLRGQYLCSQSCVHPATELPAPGHLFFHLLSPYCANNGILSPIQSPYGSVLIPGYLVESFGIHWESFETSPFIHRIICCSRKYLKRQHPTLCRGH